MLSITTIASSSRGNCYLIQDGKTSILIECGIRWNNILCAVGFDTSGVDGVLLTHEHKDHSFSAKNVIRNGLELYCSGGTADALGLSGHRVHRIKSKEQFTVKTFTILPFQVQHDAAEPLGFLLSSLTGNKVLFLTDSAFVKYRFKGLTHIMIECNYSEPILRDNVYLGTVDGARVQRLITSHMSLERVVDFMDLSDLSDVKGIYLMHLSDQNSDEKQFKEKIQGITGKPVYICGS